MTRSFPTFEILTKPLPVFKIMTRPFPVFNTMTRRLWALKVMVRPLIMFNILTGLLAVLKIMTRFFPVFTIMIPPFPLFKMMTWSFEVFKIAFQPSALLRRIQDFRNHLTKILSSKTKLAAPLPKVRPAIRVTPSTDKKKNDEWSRTWTLSTYHLTCKMKKKRKCWRVPTTENGLSPSATQGLRVP